MGTIHDSMATKCGDQVMNSIRSGNAQFKQVFSNSLSRTADWNWPRPDYVCFDAVNKCTYAIEFKPTNQTKREYLCGLGQALSYLQRHMYSGLIVPTVSDDGFPISKFIYKTLKSKEFDDVGISLYEYDPTTLDVSILRSIKHVRNTKALKVNTQKNKTFWCWWRDLSQYELFELLTLSFRYNENTGDIYTNYVFPAFWDKLSTGNSLNWEGEKRKSAAHSTKEKQKQNYKIPLNQLELWNPVTGKLTELGMRLLKIGKLYGPTSKVFMNALTYIILIGGKHLELIKLVEEYQNKVSVPKKVNDFLIGLETKLQADGFIGPRKPKARKGKTTEKPSYIRDESKVWHKLGLVIMKNEKDYFFPEIGYKFNWHVIADALVEGQRFVSE